MPELIVALDLPSSQNIPAILDHLPPELTFFKLGLELFCAEGPDALNPLLERKMNIFLDLKLHDIPHTVERAVHSAAAHGVKLLTVHACGGKAMLTAAAKAAAACGDQAPALIGVTTLTSLNQDDFSDLGISRTLSEQALALGRLARDAGIDGLVTSVHEAAALRAALGPDILLVTPGIRLPTDDIGDQKRIATPFAAVQAGADYLVVGRPILNAPDPAAAARAMLENMKRKP
ncbi:MAG: orotidine-5'-phosphate decarboxylase [Kiritimatiellae bacterium]|nr:orotidine-5'-phosphate decarboxylase [Kiritimatiellia bacterium]